MKIGLDCADVNFLVYSIEGKLANARVITKHINTTYETALRQYVAAFDGTKEEFSEVERLFDVLFHDRFTLVLKDGKTLSRDAVKVMYAWHFYQRGQR